jgi:hypothetical protein
MYIMEENTTTVIRWNSSNVFETPDHKLSLNNNLGGDRTLTRITEEEFTADVMLEFL